MRKLLFIIVLVAACAGTLFAPRVLESQSKPGESDFRVARGEIREVKTTSPKEAAPQKCLKTFRELFSYLSNAESDIIADEKAKQKWLSDDLRIAAADKVKRTEEYLAKNPTDKPEYPDNATFIGAWDYPSTYSITGSRHYGGRAVVDVLYAWGEKTNYAGDKRLMSFIFVEEKGTWKLDDVYSFRGEFASAESLIQYLREK